MEHTTNRNITETTTTCHQQCDHSLLQVSACSTCDAIKASKRKHRRTVSRNCSVISQEVINSDNNSGSNQSSIIESDQSSIVECNQDSVEIRDQASYSNEQQSIMELTINKSITTTTDAFGAAITVNTYDVIKGKERKRHIITSINGAEIRHKIEDVDFYDCSSMVGVSSRTPNGSTITSTSSQIFFDFRSKI